MTPFRGINYTLRGRIGLFKSNPIGKQQMTPPIDIIQNLTLIIALTVGSGFIRRHRSNPLNERILQGLVFGTAAVISMLNPLILQSGLLIDGRSVLISLCGLFFGPVSVGIAGAITILCQIQIDGIGTRMGILTVCSSALIGLLAHRRQRRSTTATSALHLLIFGLLVHLTVLLTIFALPREIIFETLETIIWPVLLLFPAATVIAGKILADQKDRAGLSAELLRNKEELQTTLYSLGDGVISTDVNGCVRQMNPVAEQLTEWTEKEAFGQPLETVFQIINEENSQTIQTPLQQVIETGLSTGPARHALLIGKNGTLRPITDNAAPIRNEDGQITGAVLIIRDQTHERAAEKSLRQAEQQWETTFDAVSDAICLLNKDQTIVRCNRAMALLTGLTQADLTGKSCWQVIHQTDEQHENCPVPKMMLSKKRERAELPIGDHFYEITVDPLLDETHDVQGAVHILRDITARKTAENSLRQIEWMLTKKTTGILATECKGQSYGDLSQLNHSGLILQSVGRDMLARIAGDYMSLLGTSSAIYEANGDYALGIFASGWCKLLDNASRALCATPDNATALNSGLWCCHESCWKNCSRESIRTGKPVDIQCAGGIHLYAVPITANRQIIGSINFGYGDPPKDPAALKKLAADYQIDFTELQRMATAYNSRPLYIIEMAKERLETSARLIGLLVEVKLAEKQHKDLEAQLFQSRKLEAIGQLAGGIAHDFNNMLQVILGRTELLLNATEPASDQHENLSEISKAAERSAELTRQLLAFARKQTVTPERINLNEAIASILSLLRRLIGEHIHLKWIPSDEPLHITIDPSQLNQILTNLTANARDAIQDSGQITIETSRVTLDAPYCKIHHGTRPGTYIQLVVSDTGCGMNKHTREHIFEPFFTTKQVGQGSGLGLATLYGIVHQNDGFINVYSEPGMGSVFKVYLPFQNPSNESKSAPEPSSHLPKGHETILLVEDEKILLSLGCQQLEELGYTVLSCHLPQEALQIAADYPEPIHLLITDVVMPEMNGLQLSQKISEQRPETKLLFMSGYTADIIAHHGILDERLNFMQKPFSYETLAEKVRAVLAAP